MGDIDMATVQTKLEKSIVKLVCQQNDKDDPVIVLTGIPIVSENDFCYIIAPKNHLCAKKVTNKKIVFPDVGKTSVDVTAENMKVQGDLAAISLKVSSKLVEPVNMSTQKVRDDELIYMIGFTPPESLSSHFDNGFVTAEEKQHSKGYFNHDCPPRLSTAGGEPIFNSELDLVGISCKNRGVTCAMDVSNITKGISLFHQGMENKDLHEIIEFIKQNKTECWSKQKQDEDSQTRTSSRSKRKKY